MDCLSNFIPGPGISSCSLWSLQNPIKDDFRLTAVLSFGHPFILLPYASVERGDGSYDSTSLFNITYAYI